MISILACCWVRRPPCLSSFVILHSLSFVSQRWFLCPPPPASPFIAFHLFSSFFGNAIWGLCRCIFFLFNFPSVYLGSCFVLFKLVSFVRSSKCVVLIRGFSTGVFLISRIKEVTIPCSFFFWLVTLMSLALLKGLFGESK